jgi:glycosyltransferase involved in cell wall biosynthesis
LPAPDGVTGLILDYFYAEPLPNRYAASIQILCSGAAFAARGNRFTYRAGALGATEADVLAAYGLSPAPGLELAPFFAPPAVPLFLQGAVYRRRFARCLAESVDPGRRIVMTRGETAFRLLPLLEALARRRPERRPRIVYEMHRVADVREREKRLGRRAGPTDLVDRRSRALRAREARVLGLADGVVFLTPQVAAAARATFAVPAAQLVLPSGVDPPAPAAPRRPDVDVVYAGKIEARKGLFDLCAAMTHLPGRRLAVAGGPAEAAEALRARVAAMGLADRVEVAGWLPPVRVADFLRRGRVGVCPLRAGVDAVSDRFSSPMKLLQMMALGLPVVATDLPPVRAVATHGEDALLARANDPAALAVALARLLGDEALAARLGAAARRRAATFAWPVRAARLESFLDGLAAGAADPQESPATRSLR